MSTPFTCPGCRGLRFEEEREYCPYHGCPEAKTYTSALQGDLFCDFTTAYGPDPQTTRAEAFHDVQESLNIRGGIKNPS